MTSFLTILMETLEKNGLPLIFKFSMLWNILPYYDNLHKWKLLLSQLNKGTQTIWDENKEAFIYSGRNFKAERSILNDMNLEIADRDSIDLFLLYSLIETHWISNQQKLLLLMDKLREDEVIIWDIHKSHFNRFQIYISKEEYILNILPAVNCSLFKKEIKSFNELESEKLFTHISNLLFSKSVVINKWDSKVEVWSSFSSNLKISNDSKLGFNDKTFFDTISNKWETDNCSCKPIRLCINANMNENKISLKDLLSFIYNIEEIQICISCKKYDKELVNSIIQHLPKSKFNFRILSNYCYLTSFRLSGKLFLLVIEGKIFKFCYDRVINMKTNGWAAIQAKSNSLIAFIPSKIELSNMILEDESAKSQNNFVNQIKELSKSNRRIYIIADKPNVVLEIELLDIMSVYNHIWCVDKVHITINDWINDEFDLYMIDYLPNNPSYLFKIQSPDSDAFWVLSNNYFIKKINELGGTIQWCGVEVEEKLYSEEDIINLKNMIKNLT